MNYLENASIRRQHLRLYKFEPMYRGTDQVGRTLDLTGGKLIPGHQDFIDYCLSGLKIPDLFIDSSTKHWIPILGLDVLYTLFQFMDGQISNSDNEKITDLPWHLRHRFTELELEMNALNPGINDRERITKIIRTAYNQTHVINS